MNIDIELKLHWLDSHLNIMEREITDFAETWKSDTVPQRIDDLRVILAGMQEIVGDIRGT